VKEELVKEGKDTALGVVVSVVSARVRIHANSTQHTVYSIEHTA
jgi:hypothetical protein